MALRPVPLALLALTGLLSLGASAAAAPELRLVDATVDDSATGDGSGTWEPGETVRLRVTLENAGDEASPPARGRLLLRHPASGVTLVEPAGDFPILGPGETSEAFDPGFVLEAGTELAPRARVLLDLVLRFDGALHAVLRVAPTCGSFPAGSLEREMPRGTKTPVVVQLTDDDGDGVVTACDVPDVFSTRTAFSGATGEALWTLPAECVDPVRNAAGGDLDGDGVVEIVVVDAEGHACAVDASGELLWRSAEPAVFPFNAAHQDPKIWDLDGDGAVEVVAGGTALRGADGTPLFRHAGSGRSIVVDLDLDGAWEVVSGVDGAAWLPDGTLHETTIDVAGENGVANLDSDPWPELVELLRTHVRAVDHDGTELWRVAVEHAAESPPCLADFDLDGRAEVAFATDVSVTLLDDDGSRLWSVDVLDETGNNAGCSAFDFDGDGLPEIIHKDASAVRILDAVDGALLWLQPLSSGTHREVPVVADLDADGRAELLLADSSSTGLGRAGILVFGSPDWASARRTWNQESYSVTGVLEGGGIPARPVPRWLTANDFRVQEPACRCDAPLAVDLLAEPDCGEPVACFTADVEATGGVSLSWDFGDGATSDEPSPCHAFASPGETVVRVSAVDESGCRRRAARLVEIPPPLAIDLSLPTDCTGEVCLVASVTGGTPPHELAWDFGGGPVGGKADECRELPDGEHVVRVSATDARGCVASAERELLLQEGTLAVPEVSGPGAAPLLVERSRSGLRLTCENAELPTDLHAGTLDRLRAEGYSHEVRDCRLATGQVDVPMPEGSVYYLVAARSSCAVTEGSYGRDSLGAERPGSPVRCE